MSGSAIIPAAYLIYAFAAIVLFVVRPVRQAALIAYFGGWLFLPVAHYTSHSLTGGGFTLDVIGTVLPSDLLLTKALVVPGTVVIGVLIRDFPALRRLRPGPMDGIMAAFCLTPLLAMVAGRSDPADALFQLFYLTIVWGGTWTIGRLVLSDEAGRQDLVRAIMASGLCLLPIALIEGLDAPQLYPLLYGGHPFGADGMQRYFGTRPLAFFEHGNQYGMWIAMATLAAFHLARQSASHGRALALAAVLMAAAAIASQSIGAILLLLVGGAWLLMSNRGRRVTVLLGALLVAVSGMAYLSGKARMESIAYGTPIGRGVIAALKSTGRGSLSWRVHRDLESLDTIARAPVTGYGQWDWWRPLGNHPWGLTLLLAGQFGLLSLGLLAFALLGGAVRELWLGSAGILPPIVVLSVIDAQLNSFIYVPVILAAAAIADPFRRADAILPASDRSPA